MKSISSKFLPEADASSIVLDKGEYRIDNNNWDYPCDVNVKFNIGYNSDFIFLRFDVREYETCAFYTESNDPVYEDSCVEFFISFDQEHYYNFEFNCIGTILGGYGKGKQARTKIDEAVLRNIITLPSLGRNKIKILDRSINWTLDIAIPMKAFVYTEIVSLHDNKASANFYKCGDNLPNPHYLSWSPIENDSPNFHLSEFFGELIFESKK